MILRIILGICIGLGGTLFKMQEDGWVKEKVGAAFQHILASTLECQVTCTVDFFDIITPRLYIRDLCMRASDNSWAWSAQSYRSGFSWLDVIQKRSIGLWAHAKELHAHSKMKEGLPAILSHIQELIKGPDLPIPLCITQAKIRDASCMICDTEIETASRWHCDAIKDGMLFRLKFRVIDGTLFYHSNQYLSDLKGSVAVTTTEKNNAIEYAAQIDMNGSLLQLGAYPTCFISGSWHQNRGRFQLQSIDRSLRINPLVIGEKQDDLYVEATASLQIPLLYKLFFNTDVSPVNGTCNIQFKGSLDDAGSSDGMIVCEEVQAPWVAGPSACAITFAKRAAEWSGIWGVKNELHQALHGSFGWHANEQRVELFAENEAAICLPYISHFTLHPQDVQLQCLYNTKTQSLDATYKILASHATNHTTIASSGACSIDAQRTINVQGTLGSYRYECAASLADTILSQLRVWDAAHRQTAHVSYDAVHKKYHSMIDFSVMHALCDAFLQYDLHGEGTICADGYKKGDTVCLTAHLNDATIRLPQTYNFISGATVSIVGDVQNKRVWFNDLSCVLHSGSITSRQGVVWLSDDGALQFMHIPFMIDRCLVTAKQDLFAVLSGNLLLSKKSADAAVISGNLMINRAQLKENLFSQQLQKKLLSAASSMRGHKEIPMMCDITIETKDPIRVDTNLLEANAQVGLHIKGPLQHPIIEGSVHVPSGRIRFPYQPLHISKGEITLLQGQPLNPQIELVAKNTIKNHLITLHVTGSLEDTTVLLESTPPLSNEQIVGLLIAGAHEHSLDAIIPALLMQNVTNYIFSSHRSNFYDRYIKPWMKQINVNLKPNFSDQSGRGGLRGTLEIVVNDRWRALIEKNFSLTEDTHFELEYILSDDITFRIIRDERRDVGGEVEMKWKF
ncbi:MAG TPA: translocation/assembly module TamB domain-containing protein [Candidatus Babeliales bacterium]|nr:translocation/assembly module TamB domain-containing protein [Candidatus Babeliales bacterium]